MKSLTGQLAILLAALTFFSFPQPVASAELRNNAEVTLEAPPPSTMKTMIVGVLITGSLISVFLIVERGVTLRRSKVIPARLAESQSVCHTQDDLLALRTACNHEPSPYGRLLSYCIDNLHLSRDENMEMLQTRARAEVVKRKQSTGIILTEDNELHVVCDEMVNGMVDDPVRILDLDGLIIDAVNCRGFLPLTFCVKRIDG